MPMRSALFGRPEHRFGREAKKSMKVRTFMRSAAGLIILEPPAETLIAKAPGMYM